MLRAPRPGDLGWIVQRHGALHAREYGFDVTFEALCARLVAGFAEDHDPYLERAWIAELDGERAGCALSVRESGAPGAARLRLLLVEPPLRGQGLGGRLVRECAAFARGVGYRELLVTSQDVQLAARAVLLGSGFVLTAETHHHSYGRDLVGQDWHLVL